jgi:uncharacterized protein YjbJ (UPF0337 family)
VVKWLRKRGDEAAMTESQKRVEDAKLVIAEMADEATDRAANAINSAVGELREDVGRMFTQARETAGQAVGPGTAADEEAATGQAVADPGEEEPGRSDA